MATADTLLTLLRTRRKEEVTHLFQRLDPGFAPRLYIRELSPRQKVQWMADNQRDMQTSDCRIVVMALCDEADNPVFGTKHVKELAGDDIGASVITELARLACEVSGFFENPSRNGQSTAPSSGQPPGEE